VTESMPVTAVARGVRTVPHSQWADLVRRLRDPDIDRVLQSAHRLIQQDSAALGVDTRTLSTQVRLHLPNLTRQQIRVQTPRRSYARVRLQAIARSVTIKTITEHAEHMAHSSLLIGASKVNRDSTITLLDGHFMPITLRCVRPSIGHLIQSRLHYMQSARCDSLLELGYYLPSATFPLVYLAFSACDRDYILDALSAIDASVSHGDVLILTRMFALPRTPPNMISFMISRAIHHLRADSPTQYVVTACNPMLGFTGAAFFASGFVPFATAPVSYRYNGEGYFTTRRLGADHQGETLDAPNNMLLALGANRQANRLLMSARQVVDVRRQTYEEVGPLPAGTVAHLKLTDLERYRSLLETAWSSATAHPRYALEALQPSELPNPRGQCGVSSAWLAVCLHTVHKLEATYCYGDLEADGPQVMSVHHHCWLEVGHESDLRRRVIDITFDQATGCPRDIVSEPHDSLWRKGIRYISANRLRHDQLPNDAVWPRYQRLLEAMRDALPSSELAYGSPVGVNRQLVRLISLAP
jgi:hypothetical protein